MVEKQQGYSFDTVNILGFIIKWWKPIFITTIAATLLAAVFSAPFFIKPKFKSYVILFPAVTNSISQALLGDNKGRQDEDFLQFGEEEHAEQLLQILISDLIRNKVIDKFNLMEHYEIDTESDYPLTELYKEFESNISYRRTEFLAVEIEVLDTDPKTAAEIANYISQLLDETKTGIQKERAVQALKIVETAYHNKKRVIDGIRDSLKYINQQGVFDFAEQSLALNEAYAKALMSGNKSGINILESKLKNLAEYGSDYLKLSEFLILELMVFSDLRLKYEKAKIDAEQTLPHTFIVNRAVPAEKKSYPIRWLIVVVSTICTFILTLVTLLVLENIKKIKQDASSI